MASAIFEDHPTDSDKVILRKPRYEDDDDIQEYKKPWVGLTDEEVGDLSDFAYANDEEFVRNVEAKLKEKNQ